jgi:hypothetical protein
MDVNEQANNSQSIDFFHKLRLKKSELLVSELQNFINIKFTDICEESKNINMIAIAVQDFISKMIAEFAKIWKIEFTNNRPAYSEICDGFESLITKSLYYHLMNYFADEKKIEKLYRKYSFLNLKHLGFDFILDEFDLVTQLKRMIHFLNIFKFINRFH